MIKRSELYIALILSIIFSLITLIPYWIAYAQTQPENVFSGFLINPIDGFSYLAKMRQGFDGSWLFHLSYTDDPGKGAFLFVYYLFLGHLTRWLGIAPIVLYHAARLIGAIAMFSVAFLLLCRFLKSSHLRWGAFLLILVGSGIGWVGLPFGILSSDLWIVESIPFLTAYANAHFPLATALFLALILIFVSEGRSKWRTAGISFILASLLALIQPFSLLPLFAILCAWLGWETWLESRQEKQSTRGKGVSKKWLLYGSIVIGALPWMLYDYWLTITHPSIAAWNLQNKTPSPPVLEYILGFGAVLFLAIVGAILHRSSNKQSDRLLIVWAVVQMLLLYVPFGLQRRLSLGLLFAFVPLAIYSLDLWAKGRRNYIFALTILILISIPSNLIVVGSGIAGAKAGASEIMLEKDEVAAYEWLTSHARAGELILAGPSAGNRIPAYADLRVLYGHPFETVDAEKQEALVERLYSTDVSALEGIVELEELGVTYVFFGPEERELGTPSWLSNQGLIYNSGEYSIYEISFP
jgi:hypothetical protein